MKSDALSVSRLSVLLQSTLDREPLLKGLWVRGEITNFKRHSSGHLYFSMKDKDTTIRAVMFRGNAEKLRFRPGDGQDCFFRGYVALYPRETQLQFYVEGIEAAGQGAEALALEELRKKLTEKGYFDPAAKKPIPSLPQAVGVISSPTGAVIQDIQKVLWRRYPDMPIRLFPSAVQGKEAVDSIVRGFAAMASASVSVVILARGGGSAEDLSAFNREEVVEAIVGCPLPVISAVGHEVDVTLADLAADLRAATPSAAAEMAVPIREELAEALQQAGLRLRAGMERSLRLEGERLQSIAGSYIFTQPERLIEPHRQRLARVTESVVFTQPNRLLDAHRDRLSRLQEWLAERGAATVADADMRMQQAVIKLEALSPLATLARGYAICRDEAGHVLLDADQVTKEDKVHIRLSKGALLCEVEEVL